MVANGDQSLDRGWWIIFSMVIHAFDHPCMVGNGLIMVT